MEKMRKEPLGEEYLEPAVPFRLCNKRFIKSSNLCIFKEKSVDYDKIDKMLYISHEKWYNI